MAQMIVKNGSGTITVSGSLSAANGIDLSRGDALVFLPAGSVVTITWYTSIDGINYAAAKDKDNVAITQTVAAGTPTEMPDVLNKWQWVLPIGDAAGTFKYSVKAMHG